MLEELIPLIDESFVHTAGSFPLVFQGVMRTMLEADRPALPSTHSSHELTYVRRGKLRYTIGKRDYLVTSGNTIVIQPGHEHSYEVVDGPVDLICVYFGFTRCAESNQTTYPGQVSPLSIDEFFRFAEGDHEGAEEELDEPCFLMHGQYRETVARLAERILAENESESFARELMMRCLSIELVIEVARAVKSAWERSLRVRHGKARELVLIARDFIVDNYDRDISVADAANYVFLSQGYFARAFRDEMGISPMAFLIRIRVERSCEMLRQPDMKVSSIAARVGFSSPQRFNAAFRKQIGMTPMQYRRQFTG